MLDWLFGKNKNASCNRNGESTTHRKAPEVLEVPDQKDTIDILIRKIVPESCRLDVCSIGNIISNDKKYYISYHYCYANKKYILSIWYCNGNTTRILYSCFGIDLNEKEICTFVNEHFNEIVKLLEEAVDTYKQQEREKLEEKMRHQICQERLHQKVTQYCNQNV